MFVNILVDWVGLGCEGVGKKAYVKVRRSRNCTIFQDMANPNFQT